MKILDNGTKSNTSLSHIFLMAFKSASKSVYKHNKTGGLLWKIGDHN